MSQIINFLNIVDILLTLMLGVIVNLEWTLRPHKIWISLRMVVCGDLLSVKSQSYYSSHVIIGAMHSILNKLVKSLILAIKIVCGLVEPIHILLTLRNTSGWDIISWLSCRFTLGTCC